MSITLKTGGQLLVELATASGIAFGAKTAAQKYARAQVALQVAAGFQAASTGDLAGGLAEAQSAILSKVTDPGLAAFATDLFAIGNGQLTVLAQAETALPLLAETAEGVAANVAAGMTAIASKYPAPATSGNSSSSSSSSSSNQAQAAPAPATGQAAAGN